MKKYALLLALLCAGAAAFAEDASTLAAMVGRFYIVPGFGFASKKFDDSWKSASIPSGGGAVKAFTLSFALEYGITDWLSAAVRWAPGWTVWSEVDFADPQLGAQGAENINGMADLYAGAKVQIVGAKAPVKTERVRLSAAPGFKIPMPGKNYGSTASDLALNKKTSFKETDKHAIGIGGQLYFDYVINKNFFINLFGEAIYYPAKTTVWEPKILWAEGEADYGYDLKFELEPHFEKLLTRGLTFKAGIPVTFKYAPAYDITDKSSGAILYREGYQATLLVGPTVGILFTDNALPLEFTAQYNFPVVGRNTQALHSVTLAVKAYFALPSVRD